MNKRSNAKKPKMLTVDYPKPNETAFGPHYAVRISAESYEQVEVSLDGGPYASCHNESGHWWHHLNGLRTGTHTLTAKGTHNGTTRISVIRRFKVDNG